MKSLLIGLFAAVLLAGCAAPGPNDPNYDSAKRKNVSVKQTSRGVEVTVNEAIFFDTGKYELKSGSGDVRG